MKEIIVRVEKREAIPRCLVCPMRHKLDTVNAINWCTRAGRELKVIMDIPTWCPLPDYEGEIDAAINTDTQGV